MDVVFKGMRAWASGGEFGPWERGVEIVSVLVAGGCDGRVRDAGAGVGGWGSRAVRAGVRGAGEGGRGGRGG